jgi:non-ribosomal peptide synthetase component E (peptide arylation enzyme)
MQPRLSLKRRLAVDRIGELFMIPAADVEDALRRHPDITDAALVGYGPKSDLPCAAVVSSRPLTLGEVRGYLDGIGMTDWYQPTRLELIDQLPRNPTGKIEQTPAAQLAGTCPGPSQRDETSPQPAWPRPPRSPGRPSSGRHSPPTR